MRSSLLIGIACALALHLGAILFGGLLMGRRPADHGTLQKVDLFSETEAVAEKEKVVEEKVAEQEMETQTEKAPDAAEIISKADLSAAAAAPALEAASLGAIEAALNGQTGGGGDFAGAMSFASGGRIGGLGKVGGPEQSPDDAFSMSEIDQRPRTVFQAVPIYPAGMRSVEGVVTVIFIVDPSGRVTNLRVEKSTHPEFEKPALNAVKQWKFEAAVKAGQRVSCRMRVPISFRPRQKS